MVHPDYVRQVEAMGRAAIKFHKDNPDLVPIVTWNFPRDVLVSMSFTQARRCGFVDANADGWRLLAAMLAVEPDPRREATPLMVRVALEAAKDPKGCEELLRGHA